MISSNEKREWNTLNISTYIDIYKKEGARKRTKNRNVTKIVSIEVLHSYNPRYFYSGMPSNTVYYEQSTFCLQT